MRVLLINTPVREFSPPLSFPLGLGYIAAVLKKAGHIVGALDIEGNRYSKKEALQRLKQYNPDVIGIGSFITTYRYLKWFVPEIKKIHPRATLIIGGPLPSSVPEFILDNLDVDILVLGEGEMTFKEVISVLEKNPKTNLRSINGIAFKQDNNKIFTPRREQIKDLNTIPFPDWDLFAVDKFLKAKFIRSGRRKTMGILATRSCPYRCKYCYHLFGGKVRFRSARNIVDEIKTLHKKYGVTYITFFDDLFVIDKKRVYEFCRLLKKEMPFIRWLAAGRLNLFDKDLIFTMKDAGCVGLLVGIETGSQEIMDAMNRQTTLEQAENFVKWTREVGIWAETPFMMGYPQETRETIRKTINFIKKHKLITRFNLVCPYPGTELYNDITKEGRIKNLEDFMLNLSDAREFSVNLTNFTDEELLKLRREAEKEIDEAYANNFPLLKILFYPVKFFKTKDMSIAQAITLYQKGFFWFTVKDYLLNKLRIKKKPEHEYRI